MSSLIPWGVGSEINSPDKPTERAAAAVEEGTVDTTREKSPKMINETKRCQEKKNRVKGKEASVITRMSHRAIRPAGAGNDRVRAAKEMKRR